MQIIFAATMITWAMGETLLSPAAPVIIDERARPGAGRYNRLGTVALVTGCLLGPSAGGAALALTGPPACFPASQGPAPSPASPPTAWACNRYPAPVEFR